MAKDMMLIAEMSQTLSPYQWGSRKRKSAISVVTSKVLHFDILQQQRVAGAHVCLDASQCYNRMGHSITAMCMIKHGAHPQQSGACSKLALQEATNHVATPYGVSEASYGGEDRANRGLLPPAGIGQGNRTGPGAFAVL